eukprot:TRINITY_DN8318_c0_g1_i1.p2 TRINITY_DN8318_c0_g1~~TRINITY_DN8318_c0_g1_i1.p2  ORF type:complete len:123 (-),score=24.69 TRINITY_DN8318_c0_g1_i1:26-394(-)
MDEEHFWVSNVSGSPTLAEHAALLLRVELVARAEAQRFSVCAELPFLRGHTDGVERAQHWFAPSLSKQWVCRMPPVLCVDTCLLYTSDAADEEDSVDLGGRRIIKKKKKENQLCDNVEREKT